MGDSSDFSAMNSAPPATSVTTQPATTTQRACSAADSSRRYPLVNASKPLSILL